MTRTSTGRSPETRSSRLKREANQKAVEDVDPFPKFWLMKKPYLIRGAVWDPWPVYEFRVNDLFKEAKKHIDRRNALNLDSTMDRMELLPACGSVRGVHGGGGGMDLYSLRSPSMFPRRIHLWRNPGGKIMVRTGTQSKTFVGFLRDFDATKPGETVKHLHFWKSLSISEKDPKKPILPELLEWTFDRDLLEKMYRRWRATVIFPFLELPAELRATIFGFSMGRVVQPYQRSFPARDQKPLPKPNMSLALLNKQLHGEFMAMLFSRVTFSFDDHIRLYPFLNGMSTASFEAVKSIELKFNHDTLLTMFGAYVRERDRAGRRYCNGCPHVADPSLNLQHLRICFPHPGAHRHNPHFHRACQRFYCEWALTAMHGSIKHIPHIELDGCIKDDQKAVWLELLEQGDKVELNVDDDYRHSLAQQMR